MFLKRISIRKNGKGHTYWALVKSVRTPHGPRHQVVSYLGELKPGERAGWADMGHIAKRPQPAQLGLFDTAGARVAGLWQRLSTTRLDRHDVAARQPGTNVENQSSRQACQPAVAGLRRI